MRTPNRDRLSRFTADATFTTTNLNTEVVLYQDPQPPSSPGTTVASIAFGNDGKICTSPTGEHFQGHARPRYLRKPAREDCIASTPTASVPTDNPFYDGDRAQRRLDLGATACAIPYRAYYDAAERVRLYVGDVGGNDTPTSLRGGRSSARRGANYGWPNSRGPRCASPCTEPALHRTRHNGRDAAVMVEPAVFV